MLSILSCAYIWWLSGVVERKFFTVTLLISFLMRIFFLILPYFVCITLEKPSSDEFLASLITNAKQFSKWMIWNTYNCHNLLYIWFIILYMYFVKRWWIADQWSCMLPVTITVLISALWSIRITGDVCGFSAFWRIKSPRNISFDSM